MRVGTSGRLEPIESLFRSGLRSAEKPPNAGQGPETGSEVIAIRVVAKNDLAFPLYPLWNLSIPHMQAEKDLARADLIPYLGWESMSLVMELSLLQKGHLDATVL